MVPEQRPEQWAPGNGEPTLVREGISTIRSVLKKVKEKYKDKKKKA